MTTSRTRRIAAMIVFALFAPLASAQLVLAPPVARWVDEAKQQVPLLDLAALKAAVDANETGLLLDVREPAELAASGMLPGAINMPRGIVELAIWAKVGYPNNTNLGQKITVYCGTTWRSALAAKSLKDLGFTNVQLANIRVEEWRASGYPMVK